MSQHLKEKREELTKSPKRSLASGLKLFINRRFKLFYAGVEGTQWKQMAVLRVFLASPIA